MANPTEHKVAKNDSLSKIAEHKGISMEELIAANSAQYPTLLTNPDLIHPGWVLKIPGSDATITAQTTNPQPSTDEEIATTSPANITTAPNDSLLNEWPAREVQQLIIDAGFGELLAPYGADDDWQDLSINAAKQVQIQVLGIPPDQANGDLKRSDLEKIQEHIEKQTAQTQTQDDFQVQSYLIALDYNTGGLDGAFGKKSKASLKDWQIKNDFPQSNTITQEQLEKLEQQAKQAFADNPNARKNIPNAYQKKYFADVEISQKTRPEIFSTAAEDLSNITGNVDSALIESTWRSIETGNAPQIIPASTPSPNETLYVIDPGHGVQTKENGIDQGVRRTGIAETDVINPVSAILAKKLMAAGHPVALTRNPYELLRYGSQTEIGPNKYGSREVRGAFARQLGINGGYQNVVFISLHVNATKVGKGRGAFTYVASRQEPDNKRIDLKPVRKNTVMDQNSAELGASIAKHLYVGRSTRQKAADHGITQTFDEQDGPTPSGFYAGAIVELAFIDERKHLEEMIRNPNAVAQQLFDGMTAFAKSKANPTTVASATAEAKTNQPG